MLRRRSRGKKTLLRSCRCQGNNPRQKGRACRPSSTNTPIEQICRLAEALGSSVAPHVESSGRGHSKARVTRDNRNADRTRRCRPGPGAAGFERGLLPCVILFVCCVRPGKEVV